MSAESRSKAKAKLNPESMRQATNQAWSTGRFLIASKLAAKAESLVNGLP